VVKSMAEIEARLTAAKKRTTEAQTAVEQLMIPRARNTPALVARLAAVGKKMTVAAEELLLR
jgi:hypothetical protein